MKQIVFVGEGLDMMSLRRWRERVLGGDWLKLLRRHGPIQRAEPPIVGQFQGRLLGPDLLRGLAAIGQGKEWNRLNRLAIRRHTANDRNATQQATGAPPAQTRCPAY